MSTEENSSDIAKLEAELRRLTERCGSKKACIDTAEAYAMVDRAKLLILLDRHDEACECLLTVIQSDTDFENNSGIRGFKIPFFKLLSNHLKGILKIEDKERYLVPVMYLGGALLRLGDEKTAFRIFDTMVEHIWEIERKYQVNYLYWQLYCCAYVVKKSNYNACLLKFYNRFIGNAFVSKDKECIIEGCYPSFQALAFTQYNLGRYEAVIRIIDEYWSKQKTTNIRPSFAIDGDGDNEWGGEGFLVTPVVLAVKAFALGQMSNLENAVLAMQEACDLMYKPEYYTLGKRLFADRYYFLQSRCGSLVFDALFTEKAGIDQDNDYRCLWGLGAFFEKKTANEELLKLYLLCEDRLDYEEDMDESWQSKVIVPDNLKKQIAEYETRQGANFATVFLRAKESYISGRVEESIKLFTESIQMNQCFAYSFYWRGRANVAIGAAAEAMKDYNRAIELKSNAAYMRVARLRLLLDENKYKEAYDDLKFLKDVDNTYFNDLSYATIIKVITEYKKAQIEAKRKAQEQVLQDMSQLIKNKAVSVADTLKGFSVQGSEKNVLINKALRGIELIRRTVDNLGRSLAGSIDDLAKDVKAAGKSTSTVSIETILLLSIENAVDNMFDSKYFSEFCHAYFPTRQAFFSAKTVWEHIQSFENHSGLIDFLKMQMLTVRFSDNVGMDKLLLSETHSSPLRLTILFQEIILNAIKYAAFVPRSRRFLEIEISKDDKQLKIEIKNSFIEGKSARTTQVGKEIMTNVSKTLGAQIEISTRNQSHSVVVRLPYLFQISQTEDFQ